MPNASSVCCVINNRLKKHDKANHFDGQRLWHVFFLLTSGCPVSLSMNMWYSFPSWVTPSKVAIGGWYVFNSTIIFTKAGFKIKLGTMVIVNEFKLPTWS
jgi:hypothetical protein